jgi:peptide/nickel transport system substrate-binding protein
MKLFKVLAVMVVLGMLSTLAAAAPAPAQADAPKPGGTLKFGVQKGWFDFDPQTLTYQSDMIVTCNIYRSLFKLQEPTWEPVPDMAASYSVSDDQLTWTFNLKKGIKWHNGREFVADDVKFSIDRALDPKEKVSFASYFEPVKEVKVVDDYTVQFILSKPYGILPMALTPVTGAIVPKEAVQGEGLHTKPIGTGPFKLVEMIPNQRVVLERFADYSEAGLPYLDRIEFILIEDPSSRLAALKSGDVDIIENLPMPLVGQVVGDRDVQIIKEKSSWVNELFFNAKRKPFDDPAVRNALAMALNKDVIAKTVTFGLGQAMDTMVAPAAPIQPKITPIPYDPKAAQAKLAELVPDGVKIEIVTPPEYPDMEQAGQMIASQWQQIGVNATTLSLEAGLFAQKIFTNHDYDAAICGLIAGLDPDGHTYSYFHSKGAYNLSQWSGNPEADKLMDQGRAESDPAKRVEIYSKLWQILVDEQPWIPLYSVPALFASKPYVQGFVLQPELFPYFVTTWLAK